MLTNQAQTIFKNVLAALRPAYGYGGPEGDDFVQLMQTIIREVKARSLAWDPATPRPPRPPEGTMLPYIPGPYVYYRGTDGCDDTWDIVSDSTGEFIVSFHFWDDPDTSAAARQEANACLMAASPELLESLQRLVDVFKSFPDTIFDDSGFQALDQAERVINKAMGRTAA